MPEYIICRICLTEDINADTMTQLYDDQDVQCPLVRKIEEIGSIKLPPLEDMPSLLCCRCVGVLTSAYKFRELCQESERAFANSVVKAELKLEPTDDPTQIESDTVEYIYEATNEFIDPDDDIEFDTILEEQLEDTNEQAEEINTGYDDDFEEAGELDETNILLGNASDSDYDPTERLRKPKVRKSRHGKRGRGRPRNPTHSVLKHVTAKQTNAATAASKSPEETSTNIMCEICGNIYSKRAALNIHMRRHLSEKPFECEICAKTFAGPSELNRHIRVHTGEKPFTCKYCSRSFADRSSNIRHERTHTNERPFTCGTCGKSFSYSNVLKNHMLTHTGEKPFLCIPCNKTFSRKHQLEQHMGTMTHQQTVKALQPSDAIRHTEIY
ncbi:transcription factor Ouib isoform X2 [Drosophila grimshawi]|uniref:GH18111 n=1 Tax=Drosophila grimshawi TaxID=7222 RepID=B4JGY6_DROGR|nr:transcription factor Ouib isoform X2 [Drosophila grimshawi]EDV93764.1 GH18111 [Drosophila grimshawi]